MHLVFIRQQYETQSFPSKGTSLQERQRLYNLGEVQVPNQQGLIVIEDVYDRRTIHS